MDTASGHDVMGLLKVAAKQFQQTVILITHDNDIAQMADRIVHIEDGKIVRPDGRAVSGWEDGSRERRDGCTASVRKGRKAGDPYAGE